MKLFNRRLGVLAIGAVAAGALAVGNHWLERWENIELEDCAEGEFCQVAAGWRMHYLVQGEGTPVILLHGFMDSADTWRGNMEALAAQHRVIALDALGFGFSERVAEPVYSLKHLSRVLAEFLDALQIERAVLVGHSMGGALAVQFAYDFPDRVYQLVLEDAAVYLDVPSAKGVLDWIPRRVARGALGLYTTRRHAIKTGLINAYGNWNRISDAAVEHRARAHRVRGTADALLAILESPRESDLPAAVKKIEQPTLIIWGARDHVVPLTHARRLRRELPHARLAIISDAGHIPHEEYPGDVNGLINNFLENGFESLEVSDGTYS